MKPWLIGAAEDAPQHPAVIFGERSTSYGELAELAERIAGALCRRGVGPKDRIAVSLPSSTDYLALLHAAQLCRAVVVPLNTRLTAGERRRLLERCRPRLVIDERSMLELTGADAGASAANTAVDAGETWTIVFTSGTAGVAKGVVLSHANHEASARAANERVGFREGDRWLCLVPLYHVAGISILVRAAIARATVVLCVRFDAQAAIDAIATGGVTHVSLVPTMLARMLDQGWTARGTALRCALIGGGPIARPLIERALAAEIPLYASYGLTETASQVATATPGDLAGGSSGAAPLPGVEVRIEAPDGEGVGEICLRGPQVAAGYFDDAEASGRVFRDGWLHTGDLGALDAEGRLRVFGRRSDLIVSGGENVVPDEVEAVLTAHESVAEAGVFALEDREWGERVAAVVVLRKGYRIDVEGLRAWCRGRLAAYKLPRTIVAVSELPRTASGKLRRRDLSGLLSVSRAT